LGSPPPGAGHPGADTPRAFKAKTHQEPMANVRAARVRRGSGLEVIGRQ